VLLGERLSTYFALNTEILFPIPLCACMRFTTRLLSMTGEVAATLAVGNWLRGKEGSYKILEQFTKDRDVWKAM